MNINIEIYTEGDLHCAYIADDCGGSGIKVAERDREQFAEEVGAYIADYAFADEEEDCDEDMYQTCWNILSQCVNNGQISADDDLEENMYELLLFVEDFEGLNSTTQNAYEKMMREVWANFDEWE